MNRSMKVVILAGGLGTRIEEETVVTPKSLVRIGEYPILWHIMKLYSHHGFNEFIICLGYKGYLIKEYFANYFLHQSDVTYDFSSGEQKVMIHDKKLEPWKVTLVDTGLNTQTGGRIKRIQPFVKNEPFMLTYGDAVADIDLKALCDFHSAHKRTATVTAVQPPGRFGVLDVDAAGKVNRFDEKPVGDGGLINGGFFVLGPKVFDYLKEGDQLVWEKGPLNRLTGDGQLGAYAHTGFWKCMDTLRDKNELVQLWNTTQPWKVWA